MKFTKSIIIIAAFLVCALIVSAINFNPGGDIDMKNRWDIVRGGNISIQRLSVINAPTACPTGYFMTFYNGSTATCEYASTSNATSNSTFYFTLYNATPWVDVRSWNIWGNDTLEDDLNMDTMLAAYASGGVSFFFPCGTYYLNSTWTIGTNQDNIEIHGLGSCSIISLASGSNSHLIKLNGADYIYIHDIVLDGNFDENAKDLDCINTGLYSNDLRIQDTIIKDCGGNAIDLIQTSRAIITGNYLDNLGNISCTTSSMCAGVNIAGSNNILVANNYINDFYGDGGVFVASNAGVLSKDITITGNIIRQARGDQGAGVTLYTGERISITGNQMNDFDNTSHGINGVFMANTGSNNHVVVSGNYMNITGVGVETNNADYITISGNVIEGAGTGSDANGIYSSGDYITITGNVINNMWSHGIYLTGTHTDHIVTGNIIKNTRNAGSGIRLVVTGAFNNTIISDNVISDNAGYGMYLSGGGTLPNLQMHDNIIYGNALGQLNGMPAARYSLNITGQCPYIYVNSSGCAQLSGCGGTETKLGC